MCIGAGCTTSPSPETSTEPLPLPINDEVSNEELPKAGTMDEETKASLKAPELPKEEEQASAPPNSPVKEMEEVTEDVVDTNTSEPTQEENQNQPGVVKQFDITAKKWSFSPDTIKVNKGDTVSLHIKSIDVDHGIQITEFGVSQMLAPGKTEVVEFVADKTGTFSFFCNVFCGHGHGTMSGTLIVQ